MNDALIQKRLKFAVNRVEAGFKVEPGSLIVKAKRNPGHKCKDGRDEFAFNRNNNIVKADAIMLEANKEINAELLYMSFKRLIAENSKSNDTTLSA